MKYSFLTDSRKEVTLVRHNTMETRSYCCSHLTLIFLVYQLVNKLSRGKTNSLNRNLCPCKNIWNNK